MPLYFLDLRLVLPREVEKEAYLRQLHLYLYKHVTPISKLLLSQLFLQAI